MSTEISSWNLCLLHLLMQGCIPWALYTWIDAVCGNTKASVRAPQESGSQTRSDNTQRVVQIYLPEAKAKGPSTSLPHFVLEMAEKHLLSWCCCHRTQVVRLIFTRQQLWLALSQMVDIWPWAILPLALGVHSVAYRTENWWSLGPTLRSPGQDRDNTFKQVRFQIHQKTLVAIEIYLNPLKITVCGGQWNT